MDTQPLVDRVRQYEGMLNRIMHDLGLTPRARIQLGLDKKHRKTLADLIVETQDHRSGEAQGTEDETD